MKHKDLDHLYKEVTIKQGEESNWPQLDIICFRETEEDSKEFGNWLAEQLSNLLHTLIQIRIKKGHLYNFSF